jgi:hypothetical protein
VKVGTALSDLGHQALLGAAAIGLKKTFNTSPQRKEGRRGSQRNIDLSSANLCVLCSSAVNDFNGPSADLEKRASFNRA